MTLMVPPGYVEVQMVGRPLKVGTQNRSPGTNDPDRDLVIG